MIRNITIPIQPSIEKIRQHLALVGKRAKDSQGHPMFSDLTVSTAEDNKIFPDLVKQGAETLVNQLSPFAGGYSILNGNIIFTLTSNRWSTNGQMGVASDDITLALTEAIGQYVISWATAQYFSIIHPSTGAKYPPIFGSPYATTCEVLLSNIIGICNAKRPAAPSARTYADITSTIQ